MTQISNVLNAILDILCHPIPAHQILPAIPTRFVYLVLTITTLAQADASSVLQFLIVKVVTNKTVQSASNAQPATMSLPLAPV